MAIVKEGYPVVNGKRHRTFNNPITQAAEESASKQRGLVYAAGNPRDQVTSKYFLTVDSMSTTRVKFMVTEAKIELPDAHWSRAASWVLQGNVIREPR